MAIQVISKRMRDYLALIRFDKPIGTLLLLWPTLWALWLANRGMPSFSLLLIFSLGTFLMRSFGCVVNDIADRHFDVLVERTKDRPLASKKITLYAAVLTAFILGALSFCLLLFCNAYTIKLGFIGAAITLIYPYLKRVTHLPQLGLGLAFAFGIPMAFAASTNHVPFAAWFLYATTILWPIIYDTMYAMVDRSDDVKIGVKSTAILFGKYDRLIIGILQVIFLAALSIVGFLFALNSYYQICLIPVGLLFFYQQWLISHRKREDCFIAFKNNHYVGLMVFAGILWGLAP